MTRTFPFLMASALIAGCASTVTEADLRQANEGSTTTVASLSHEAAYKIIATESRRCFEKVMPGANVVVRADLYNESKTAEISIAGVLMGGSVTEVLFDIRATGLATSEIKTFYRKKSSESVGNAMRAWLKGNKEICHA